MAASRSTMADFIVTQQLGKGSYGSVSKVKRKQDNQFYAIKDVNIKKLQPREREDALNEIRIMASIKHKNIVRYCDAFTEKDSLFIVMEFAEHGDISRQIDKFKAANKYIKEDTIWSYLIQMCNGLALMHGRNVLHRDLKPKNVFLTGKNHLRLGDLGCAKLMKAGMARTQIGTPYYMSPEIWMNRPYDAKSDVWALGCLMYELAMLSPPFIANDMAGLAVKVKTAAAPRVSKHYSEDLQNLVASMLSKDPKSRPNIKDVLAMPCVAARMHTLPPDEETPWAGEDMRMQLISTIKVPAGFGMGFGARPGAAGGLVLPAPNFPTAAQIAGGGAAAAVRPASSPSKLGAGAPTAAQVGAADGGAKIILSGGGAIAPAAPPPALAALPPPAPIARRPLSAAGGNFAAPAVGLGAVKPIAAAAPPAFAPAAPVARAPAAPISAAYAPRAVAAVPASQGFVGRAQAHAAAAAAAAALMPRAYIAPAPAAYRGAAPAAPRLAAPAPSRPIAAAHIYAGARAMAPARPIVGRLF